MGLLRGAAQAMPPWLRSKLVAVLSIEESDLLPLMYSIPAALCVLCSYYYLQPLGDTLLLLPRSRSNSWPRSWKRFLIDYM